ncbi:MAG: SDR family NAD(P)-dependent oxidoreductase [Lachnoclostridium sp.]
MKEKIFESKVALITGGAGGIGFAVAELLIQKGIAHVILIDTNKNMLEESACKLDSERVHTCILDITKEIEVKNAIKKINEKYKRIDLLVNMAGIAAQCPNRKLLFRCVSKGIFRQCIRHISHDEILPAFYAKTEKRFHCKRLLLFRTYGI